MYAFVSMLFNKFNCQVFIFVFTFFGIFVSSYNLDFFGFFGGSLRL